MEPPPPRSPQDEASHTHSHPSTSIPVTGTRCKCGGSTTYAPPTQSSTSWPDLSSPPAYRPIRAPALNLPPNNTQAIILTPVPQSQKVPTITPPFHFQIPSKKITSPDDIRKFHDSPTSKNFLGFIVALSESIRGRKISDPCHESLTVSKIVSIIENLSLWVDQIPPFQQTSRYGNISYRTWHERLTENAESLMRQFLPDDLKPSTIEIVPYFSDGFGNSSRIDYGTGHETNFAAWLYCLARMGLVYCLEPAGSHGVWGLDDYHFLPFIFGSSQLIDHKYMKPKSIHNEDILENFSSEYMYLSCTGFIKKVKKGPFAEHSPLLDDISAVPHWKKVNGGMLKMYKAEVLEKVPIMQHFLFGWLIKW
ncbi:EXORDIUM like 2 [Hibiscus syriacus]|uniref:Serine/threonine-protein phosphatase 2A activator n=1 Tax=Hibiscus syriacus TaxID=106335 RepID=A0A6A3CIH2_HIBSY|nr:EXORDIUM like 2 [Hibiscus syriacus]